MTARRLQQVDERQLLEHEMRLASLIYDPDMIAVNASEARTAGPGA